MGLHYNRFRYYDPDVGRFVSQDPIGLEGGQNLYQYAPNPSGWVDEYGLKCLNRKSAFNLAKDTAGIPRSQQPLMQWEVGNDVKKRGLRNYSYSDNPAEFGRFYLYENAEKQLRVVVEHIADPCGRSHFHAGKPKKGGDPKNYNFKENRYQKIEFPTGDPTKPFDHHIYYE